MGNILKEIKDQVALEYDWVDWICFLSDCPEYEKDVVINEVAIRYAQHVKSKQDFTATDTLSLRRRILELEGMITKIVDCLCDHKSTMQDINAVTIEAKSLIKKGK